MSQHKPEDGIEEWGMGKFRHGRYIGQLYGNTDWAFARLVWSAALEYERGRKEQERHKRFDPSANSRETADQMAAVILQHGTPEQQKEALAYAMTAIDFGNSDAERQARADTMDPQEIRSLMEEIEELRAELAILRRI